MVSPQRRYLSYLLRLWQTSDNERQIWRASLESPGTGERRGFASLKDLFDFLLAEAQIPDARRPLTDRPARDPKAKSPARE